ncbi:sugar ABC transporter permease [Rhizobium sp. NLR17b]|uniref:carbohydrate ABC transporter permease n=1 Tax=Rhizobium sp. NLR17b TaxID=2731114 RepID=UPI001C8378A0|nr:sugar ABC transporter permease [Rhizobium sp. NLR17b]MBX5272698.1 sugar ABC transporter permease [Rhizobium sp. NLR17b]
MRIDTTRKVGDVVAYRGRHAFRSRRSLSQTTYFWPAVFFAPALIGFCAFTLYPAVASLGLSFTSWNLNTSPKWVGLANYQRLVMDPTAIKVFWNTVYFTVATVPVLLVIPLLLAIALNQNIAGVRFFRAAYFLPVISSMVAMSMVWQWMYNADFGLINWFLSLFGIQGPKWITSENWAMPAVMITSVWKNIGFNMMLFLAGLQGISTSYYEAAELDGANSVQKLWYITLPSLRPTTLFVTVITIINSFQVFDQVMVMTGGGPNRASSVLVHYIYQNGFQFYKMGYASALGWALTLLVLALTLIQFRLNKSRED